MIDNEVISVRGDVTVELYSSDGSLKHREDIRNLVTTAGKNFIVRKMNGDSETINKIAIGDGSTVATLLDVSLANELARSSLQYTFVDTVETNVIRYICTFAENIGTGTIREVGLLSDSVTPKLLCRTVLTTPFSKQATDYLVVNWKLQIG